MRDGDLATPENAKNFVQALFSAERYDLNKVGRHRLNARFGLPTTEKALDKRALTLSDFVRIVGDEVVRVETMKVGGEKIVRTEREVILEKPDKDTEAKKEQEDRPPNAPSLRRPGEDSENAPKPADGVNPMPPVTPPDIPQPSGPPAGPGEMVAGHR